LHLVNTIYAELCDPITEPQLLGSSNASGELEASLERQLPILFFTAVNGCGWG
jgi:hypothetical protein